MPAFKGMTMGESLDHFHQRCVVPEPEEVASRNEEIDGFVRFLQTRFGSSPYTVDRVLKSGSLGKGTAIHGSADIDLVVIMNGLNSIDDLVAKRPQLLKRLESEVEDYRPWKGRVQLQNRTIYSLGYTLNGQDVDVLPAVDVFRSYGSKEGVYRQLSNGKIAQEISASLARLQIDFVKTIGEDVKRVIRLLKYWKKERGVDIRSYTLELMTIYTDRDVHWRRTQDLFREVLSRLAKCRSLEVIFSDNYNGASNARHHRAPYVVDPANPFMNTLHGKNIDNIAQEARSMLDRL